MILSLVISVLKEVKRCSHHKAPYMYYCCALRLR